MSDRIAEFGGNLRAETTAKCASCAYVRHEFIAALKVSNAVTITTAPVRISKMFVVLFTLCRNLTPAFLFCTFVFIIRHFATYRGDRAYGHSSLQYSHAVDGSAPQIVSAMSHLNHYSDDKYHHCHLWNRHSISSPLAISSSSVMLAPAAFMMSRCWMRSAFSASFFVMRSVERS
jgi:hypothetical protein